MVTMVDPFALEILDDPYDTYAKLRSEAPLYKVPHLDLHLVLSHGAVMEAIARVDDESAIGSISLFMIKPGVGEFGYWLARDARGRGYTPRALRLFARWAFEELELPRLQLGTLPGNTSSERVAEKVGFAREGVLRSYLEQRGERRDVTLWSLLPGELR